MRTLDRYIATTIISSYGLVLLLFAGIFGFFVLVDELDQVGTGQYNFSNAVGHVVMTLPSQLVDLAPITALLGSLLGLGTLANRQELIAMQALGVASLRIAWSVLRVGILFMLTIVVFEQFVNPPLAQYAHTQRALALSNTGTLFSEHGFWIHDQRRFIKVGKLQFGKIPEDIDVYQFDEHGELQTFTHARKANILDPNQWVLLDVDQKRIGPRGITSQHREQLMWKSFLSTDQVEIISTPPEIFSLSDLYAYLRYLQDTHQNSRRFEFVFWQKVAMPFTTGAMVLLAIPFVFGPLRASSLGKRILIGVSIAIPFYLLNQTLGHLGLLYELNPFTITFAPMTTILGIAAWLWRKHL